MALCSKDLNHACRDISSVERLLVHPQLRIVASEPTEGGEHGARVLTVELPAGSAPNDPDAENAPDETKRPTTRFRVKWRPLSDKDGVNDPRKEVLTYAFQKLFLDPEDYVFPPTRTRCFGLAHYRKTVNPHAQPNFPQKSSCVLGTVSYWLVDAKSRPDDLWRKKPVLDDDQWEDDEAYRRTLADANLLAYLTSNGDTHPGQWVFYETEQGERAYLVDATIAFDYEQNTQLPPERDYGRLIVPALRQQSLERVMALDRDALWSLTAVERLVPQQDHLQSSWASRQQVQQPPRAGMAWQACPEELGCEKQFVIGLTEPELQLVGRELWHLRNRVDVGELRTFRQP